MLDLEHIKCRCKECNFQRKHWSGNAVIFNFQANPSICQTISPDTVGVVSLVCTALKLSIMSDTEREHNDDRYAPWRVTDVEEHQ